MLWEEPVTMREVIHIGLADDNLEFANIVKEYLERYEDLKVVGIANDGLQTLQMLRETPMDLLLLDMIMPKLDGMGVLEQLRNDGKKTKIIIFSAFGHDETTRKAVELGADYFIVKPFDLEVLARRIREVVVLPCHPEVQRQKDHMLELEREVSQILHKLRIPPHFKGYTYLREAILCCIKEPTMVNEVTKRLYPYIAEKMGTTRNRVERSMRFAIETACERGELDYLYQLMGYTVDEKKGKPTNASFIAKIADQVRLEMKVKN